MSIELSICIPTFNRAKLLNESLQLLVPQCEGRPVEICISNNASTDETAAVLASYPDIRCQTQPLNVGIDRNTLAALRMAKGRYVLPIGDDELIGARGIDSILTALRTRPDMLVLNGWHRARPHLPTALHDRTIVHLHRAFELLWDKMPLGSFVIPRAYAEPRYADRYLDTHHAYSGAAWDYLLDLDRVRIHCMAHPVIEFRQVTKSYAAWADVIHFKDIPRWFDLLPSYYADVVVPTKRQYERSCRTLRARLHFGAIRLRRYA
jgi:glycosyltransferase involved in cell wall biosynthesis